MHVDAPNLGSDPVAQARGRAVVAFTAFASGLALARLWVPLPGAVPLMAAVALVFAASTQRWGRARLLLTLAATLGAWGWASIRWHERSGDDVAVLAGNSPRAIITVEGMVTTPPRRTEPPRGSFGAFARQEPAHRFELRVDRALREGGWSDATGGLWVRVAGPETPRIAVGGRVRVTGVFAPVRGPRNPGEPDRRLTAAQSGMSGFLTTSDGSLLSHAEPARGMDAAVALGRSLSQQLKDRAGRVLDLAAGDSRGERRALLGALLLGEYDPAHEEVRDAFARTGLAHVLSISGFHIVILAAFLSWGVRLFGERGATQQAAVGAALIAYLALAAPSAPVVRAVCMAIMLTGVEWTGRRYDRVTVLIWVVIGLLVWRPLDLWSLGFQLSAGLTALLLWAGPTFHDRLFPPPIRGLSPRPRTLWGELIAGVRGSVSASLLCTAASAPLVLLRIGVFTPIAALATVIVSPLVAVLLFVAYGALLIGLCFPGGAALSSGVLAAMADLVLWSVRLLESIPGATVTGPPVGALWTAAATVFVVAAMVRTVRPGLVLCGGVVLAAWLGVATVASQGPGRAVAVRIDALDVGDGTCMLVRSGGRAVLWDCGALGGIDPEELVRACRAMGAWRVPLAVVSHPDIDHFGLMPEVAQGLGVERVLVGERFFSQAREQPGGTAAALLAALEARGVRCEPIRAGDVLALGGCELRVIAPAPGADFANDNDHSIIARVVTPGIGRDAALLCGDAQDQAIAAVASGNTARPPLIMEAPHHGSARPAAIAWVASLDPAVVLQSSGPSRANDPRWESIHASRAWLSTSERGACWAEVLRDGGVRSGYWLDPD
ncbi:MAG: ComEC/Rec2 family competence protein [Phycisphaerales bacterium]